MLTLLHHHVRRARTHRSVAVRFAYWNTVINGAMAVVFIGPVMALSMLSPLGHKVMWVTFLSVWALFATHAGGCLAAFAALHSADKDN